MKIGPLHPPTTFGLAAPSEAQIARTQELEAKAQTAQIGDKGAIDPEKLRLAREFEQIFIRKMLSSLEKSGRNAAGGGNASGNAYGSMVVGALAEAVSKGGGVGLAEMIARAATQATAAGPTTSTGTTHAIQAAIAGASDATRTASAPLLGAATSGLAVPDNVRITVAQPATTATYARPTPTVILNENNDMNNLLKDPNL